MASIAEKNRIGKMIAALKKAEAGNYSVALDVSSKKDEIDLLADAINKTLKKTVNQGAGKRKAKADPEITKEPYRNMLDSIQESYFETDLKGNLLFFNDAVMKDLGYTAEGLAGMNFQQLVDKENSKKVYDIFHKVFLTGEAIKGFDWQILKKNKSILDVESSVALRHDEKGDPQGFRGIVRDVTRRKQAEKELQKSEEKYSTILDSMGEAYFENDLQGKITFVNDTACRLLGYSRDEFIGMSYKEYLTPQAAGEMYKIFHRIYETGKPILLVDYQIVRKDGTIKTYQFNATLMRDTDGKPKGFRILSMDVSEHKKSEAARRLSEEKYRDILETIREGYFETDLNGTITFANDAGCILHGYERGEMIGVHYKQYSPPETARLIDKAYRNMYDTRIPTRMLNCEVIRRDGLKRIHQQNAMPLINESGEIKGFRTLSRDITEQVMAEEALRLSEKKYRNILENMQETYLETDQKGNFVFFNDSLCRLLGYSHAELLNMNYSNCIEPQTIPSVIQIFNEIYRTDKPKTFITHELIAKDGSKKIVEMSISLRRDTAGEPAGFYGVARDVTQKIKADHAIRKNERHLRLITENIHDIIWTMDFDLRYTYISPSCFTVSGYKPEEIIGLPLEAQVPPPIYAKMKKIFAEELSKEQTGQFSEKDIPFSFEFKIMRKDGRKIWVEISASSTRNEDGKPFEIVGTTRDISERKKAEEALRESEKRYRMIIDNIHDTIWTMDFNLQYTYLAPSIEKLTGYMPEELKQVPLNEQLTPASLALVEKIISEEFAAEDRLQPRNPNATRSIEVEFVRKDGSRHWQEVTLTFNRDENDKPFEILGVTRDISDRKRTEAIIQESEKRYRMIAENMNDIIWTIGLDLQFIYVSPSSTRVTGYTPEETRQTPLNKLLTPKSFAHATKRLADELAQEASGEPFDRNRHITIEIEALHKEGGAIWLEITGTFNRDNDGNVTEILVVGKEITARKKVEIALEESEKRYRMIVENMHDVICIMDFNFHFTYVSNSNLKLTGYTKEEVKEIPVDKLLTPESLERITNILGEELEREKNTTQLDDPVIRLMELEIFHKEGGTTWAEVTATFNQDENGKAIEIIFAARDITERKKIQEALKESETRYRMIVENMHEIIWTTDLNLQYTYVSPSVLWLTGYTPEELKKIPPRDLLTPQSYALAEASLAEEIAREFSGSPIEIHRLRTLKQELYHKNGGTIWLEVTATFNRDENNKPIGMMMVGRDISEHKKAEEEKDKLEKQLIQAQKMETVGRLAGGVAHDFNNMLSVILGYVDLAKLRLPEGNSVLKDISEIEKAAIRSKDITAQLLAFSRKQIIAPKNINLNKMIANSQKSLARLIGEDIDLKFHPEDGLWLIKFDPSQIEQILMNLAVNARDAMPLGGKLTIETANVRLNDAYCREHLGFMPGYYVRLAISDDGTGINKETLPYIFEPFFTTKETGKGTGLGLATVYGIVKQNGGFINVYSEPEQGTTFKMYLPRSVEEMDIKQGVDEEPLLMGSGNILLVEDDALVLQMVTNMLESAGYTVIASPNPLEALNFCEQGDRAIDLVITDVVMPIMSGRELRDRLGIIRPDIKVLFMSGYTANVIVHHGVLEEGVHFLQKPFSLRELARKLSEIIAIGKA